MESRPSHSKASIAIPFLIIAVGLGWLLTSHHIIPGVDWVWVLGMGVVGILTMTALGIDKFTVVVGPFLITATFFSILRQTGRISVDTEVPSLFIVIGVLMLISHFLPVPAPSWWSDDTDRGPR